MATKANKHDILSRLKIDAAKVRQDFASLGERPSSRRAMGDDPVQMPSLRVLEVSGIDVQQSADGSGTDIVIRLAVDPDEVRPGAFQPKWARLNDRPLEDLEADRLAERVVRLQGRAMREVVLRARGNKDSEYRLRRAPLTTIEGSLHDGRHFSGTMISRRDPRS